MIRTSIFRVTAYSASTSHFTVCAERAAHLHQFLTSQGIHVEPMVEATGTILRGYVDEADAMCLDAEPAIITFVADATPIMLQPLLQLWFSASGAAPKHEENQQDGNGNADEPHRDPSPGA